MCSRGFSAYLDGALHSSSSGYIPKATGFPERECKVVTLLYKVNMITYFQKRATVITKIELLLSNGTVNYDLVTLIQQAYPSPHVTR